MLPNSFDKAGSIPGEYSIIHDLNVLPVQHESHRILIEANEDIESQLKEKTAQGITTLVGPMPWGI